MLTSWSITRPIVVPPPQRPPENKPSGSVYLESYSSKPLLSRTTQNYIDIFIIIITLILLYRFIKNEK